MKPIYFLILLFAFSQHTTAQTIADSIKIEMNKFYYKNKKLTVTKLYDIVSSNQESKKEMRKATAYSITAGIIGGVGILNVIYPLGMAFAGNELNVVNLGAGAAIIGLSIPFAMANKKHLKKAIKLYNGKLKTTSYNQPQFKLNFSFNALQLSCNF